MPKEFINPPSLFPSTEHGFSQIVVASGSRTVYVAGQTAWDHERRLAGGMDLTQQARQAFRNVQTAVEAAGGNLGDVVSLRIYIVDYKPADANAVSRALREFFQLESCPASTWIGVSSLAVPDFLIEVEAIAVLD
jgi:enamine deaminase RidA (YjgF/YER057c/UK114 family)